MSRASGTPLGFASLRARCACLPERGLLPTEPAALARGNGNRFPGIAHRRAGRAAGWRASCEAGAGAPMFRIYDLRLATSSRLTSAVARILDSEEGASCAVEPDPRPGPQPVEGPPLRAAGPGHAGRERCQEVRVGAPEALPRGADVGLRAGRE